MALRSWLGYGKKAAFINPKIVYNEFMVTIGSSNIPIAQATTGLSNLGALLPTDLNFENTLTEELRKNNHDQPLLDFFENMIEDLLASGNLKQDKATDLLRQFKDLVLVQSSPANLLPSDTAQVSKAMIDRLKLMALSMGSSAPSSSDPQSIISTVLAQEVAKIRQVQATMTSTAESVQV